MVFLAFTDGVMRFNAAKVEEDADVVCVLSKIVSSKEGFAIKYDSIRKSRV